MLAQCLVDSVSHLRTNLLHILGISLCLTRPEIRDQANQATEV